MHTSMTLGIQFEHGHQDFWPNGGSFQSGCKIVNGQVPIQCDHERSHLYFIESILWTNKFETGKFSFGTYLMGGCDCRRNPNLAWWYGNTCNNHMGFYADRTKPEGSYYLDTYAQSTFSIS